MPDQPEQDTVERLVEDTPLKVIFTNYADGDGIGWPARNTARMAPGQEGAVMSESALQAREIRVLRREWRRLIRKAGRMQRGHYPALASRLYERAETVEAKIRSVLGGRP